MAIECETTLERRKLSFISTSGNTRPAMNLRDVLLDNTWWTSCTMEEGGREGGREGMWVCVEKRWGEGKRRELIVKPTEPIATELHTFST